MTRRRLLPPGMPIPSPDFSPGIAYKHWVFASGLMASDYRTGLLPDARGNPAIPLAGEGQHMREARALLTSLDAVLAEGGAHLADGVRIDQFPASRAVMDPYQSVRSSMIPAPRPSSQSVHIDALMVPQASIQVDMLAVAPGHGIAIEAINSDAVPSPLGLFTQASKAGDYVFPAGQLATDWRSGLAPEVRGTAFHWGNNQVERETRYILRNIGLTLEAAGSSLQNIVKAQVYLTNIEDLPRVDRVWREVFPLDPPARTVFPVHSLGVVGTSIEINVVAVTNSGNARKEVITTERARKPVFHESQAVRAGDFLFLSGLMAADADGLIEAARVNPNYPYATESAAIQAEAIFTDAHALCEAAGCRLSDAVRMTTIHTDLREAAAVERVRRSYFPDGLPATTTFQVPGALSIPGCSLLVDLWVGAA